MTEHTAHREGGSARRVDIRPLFVCFGLFNAGCFLQLDPSAPLAFAAGERDETVMLLLVMGGCLIGALSLLVAFRSARMSDAAIRRLTVASLVGIICVALCCFARAAFPEVSVPAAYVASALLALCYPVALALWALAFKTLDLRGTLLNASLALLMFALVIGWGNASDPAPASVLAGACLVASTLAFVPLARAGLTDEPVADAADADPKKPSALQLATSIPVLAVCVSSFTTGATQAGSASPSVDPALACFAVALAGIGFSLSAFASWQERKLSFALFRIGLPALAACALIIKMIPLEAFSTILFRDYMFVLFQLAALVSWVYLTSLLRTAHRSAAFVCGCALVACACALGTGLASSLIGYVVNRTALGLITAFLLIFSATTLGRSLILYSKGTESEIELTEKPLDIESTCALIGEQYRLSPRETEVLVELAYGHASSYVAKVLFISNNTARTHMKNIYRKLDVNSREDLLEIIRKTQKGC